MSAHSNSKIIRIDLVYILSLCTPSHPPCTLYCVHLRNQYFRNVDSPQAKIDFVVGKDERIPVEVKLAKEKMRPHLGTGSAQVKEFLRYSGTRKGILVIGDQERDPERQKYGGMQDRVYIVVI